MRQIILGSFLIGICASAHAISTSTIHTPAGKIDTTTMSPRLMAQMTANASKARRAGSSVSNTVNAKEDAVTTIVQEISFNHDLSNTSTNTGTTNPDKEACLLRAKILPDTFVWAARNSNSTNYASLIEDITNPQNNICYVKISVHNSDDRVETKDIPTRYFPMGQTVTCGGWLDNDDLKERVLVATKKQRVLGTVATTLIGAGAGVGISEGAMAIAANQGSDSKLMGQRALDATDLIISHIKKLQHDNIAEYNRILDAMRKLDEACDSEEWVCDKPADCDEARNPFRNLRAKMNLN